MTLSDLVKPLEIELSGFNRVRTMKAYAGTLRCVLAFTHRDPEWGEVFNPAWLLEFQSYLLHKGLKRNTVSFYMRMLRSIYNKSVDAGLCTAVPRLFFRVYTGLAPTIKRSLTIGVIHALARARLSGTLEYCRDMFMLCFYLQGMTFVDLAYLKKTDIQGNVIMYVRKKSGSQITVVIGKKAQSILRKYARLTEGSEYAFPIIVDPLKDPAVQYQSALRTQNRNLKKLAAKLGLDVNLTTYVARHSWATMAYHNQVPTPLIKEAMGHRTEETTRIYLASFGLEKLSQANEIVAKAVEKEGGKEYGKMIKKKRKNMAKKNVRHLISDGQESDANI